MVFFNCNACGEALKKNQVEKHCQFKCRSCESLSCVDCGKDFWGNDYEQHTKCISEEEKYSGKDFKPKANANKGEQKQEAWTQHVQAAVEKARANPRLKNLLVQIIGYDNIPRKKAKYENFLRNSMRIRDNALISQSWDLISAEMSKPEQKPSAEASPQAKNTEPQTEANNEQKEETATAEKKLNKREKKEERQKKNKKKDKKTNEDDEEKDGGKKKKKRKRDELEEAEEEGTSKKKNKKRKQDKENGDDGDEPSEKKTKQNGETMNDSLEETVEEAPVGKFEWEATIIQCLQTAKSDELSMKKLSRKVIGEFWARGGDQKIQTEDRALAKMLKTITRCKRLKVNKNKVSLVEL